MSRIAKITALLAASALALVGCANSDATGGTVTEGKLTIATGEPAYEPWVVDNKPESGEGFEAAVAYAVAEKLGYKKEDVKWVRETFEGSIAPGEKNWDLNIQQFSITEERKKAVDLSKPYYTTTQAVVAANSSSFASAKSLAELKGATIGVAVGTTSKEVVTKNIAPLKEAQVFNTLEDAVAALQAGNIDAVVTDLPGAFYVRDAQLEGDGVIIGQIDTADAKGDELAFVLPKDSALTAKVNTALEALAADGTLDMLAKKWFAEHGAPVLK
ncbi:ABC transporter substrate-binding protein [Canibacter sp. lx-45]|uniref:ABC transporter substrate-binding protein n=1 Tax=Canibacter zhuwentaonis TaxID=2837491 RepID=UPI001BDD27BC|nr:ABC transporter substrate-binding protein [Canibacter zhuwentaonis]MBT1034761.1 ABC transporter substrate-binding protein [Canibacter zhuwentaonis]